MFFELAEITGFETFAPLIIVSKEGQEFYYLENPKCERRTFNLPKGNYYTTCKITPLKRPLKYVCPNLPTPEKRIPILNIEIKRGNNKNKASIDVKTGAILVDNTFTNPIELAFILGHEIGHFKYKTEWKCDLFSIVEMLKRGFNPSQCLYNQNFCLSDKQDERKEIVRNFLSKIKTYE